MPDKVLVTMRAILQRLNRRLVQEHAVLKAARGQYAESQVGAYYCIDITRNVVTADHVDPIGWAREFGLLQPWETVEGEDAAPPEPPPAPAYDPHKFFLGSLCKHGHAYLETGQSLRRLSGGCVACDKGSQRKATP